jgi:hypothetical protein
MSERPVIIRGVDPPQDGSPSWDEVEQREGLPELPIPAVPVHVDGPVQTQNLPPRTSVVRSVQVDNLVPQEILAKDLRRSRAVLYAHDSRVVYGLTSTDCLIAAGSRANGAYWPQNLQLTINGSSRLFVASATATPTLVSVIAESWAD